MALEAYGDKRDFATTPEPPPKLAAKEKRHRDRSIFVVQEHHASRLHYDFRLEAEGVLKSWAVPKGPSMDPAHKRLAIQVEDHLLAYATFTGTIPEGQYGAGTVAIWDQGTYVNLLTDQTVMEGIAAGRMEFALHGKQLRGRFVLVRIRGKGHGHAHWLLMKMHDTFARPAGRMDSNARAHGTTHTSPRHSALSARVPAYTPANVRRTTEPREAGVTYTHADKLMYPESGITKGDVLDFYRRMAPRLLPYLRDRPATLERLPEGLRDSDAPRFWQKRTPDYYPEWIERVELPSEDGQVVPYVLVNSEETLL